MTFLDENPVTETFWKLYGETFASLYLYCARRATAKPVIAFIMKSLYENALDEMKHDEVITLLDLYKWAYEFFSIQSKPSVMGAANFSDVKGIKTDSSSRTIKREEILDGFYKDLTYKEREVLWLGFFEELGPVDRSIVMGMNEEECTKMYFEVLKKAKDIIAVASASQKGLSKIASYFGSVASLLKKAKEQEGIVVDQEIYTSLRELFMDQFARNSAAQNFGVQQPVTPNEPVMPPMPEPVVSRPTPPIMPPIMQPEPARAQPIAYQNVQSNNNFDDNEDFEEDEMLGNSLLRKLQGFAVVVAIVMIGSVGYFKFFSETARVNHLLADSRVQFGQDFNQVQKENFIREALLPLSKHRDFSAVKIDRKDKEYVQVSFNISGDGKESFLIYREEQPFVFANKWQPKSYTRFLSV